MRHRDIENKDRNEKPVKCKQRLKEVRYHGVFKGFYCRICDKYLLK